MYALQLSVMRCDLRAAQRVDVDLRALNSVPPGVAYRKPNPKPPGRLLGLGRDTRDDRYTRIRNFFSAQIRNFSSKISQKIFSKIFQNFSRAPQKSVPKVFHLSNTLLVSERWREKSQRSRTITSTESCRVCPHTLQVCPRGTQLLPPRRWHPVEALLYRESSMKRAHNLQKPPTSARKT